MRKLLITPILFLVLSMNSAFAESQSQFLYLGPQKHNGNQALFIFSPGANRKSEEYRDLMARIQEHSNLELAMAILQFKTPFPNSYENSSGVQAAIDFAKSSASLKDLKPNQVFLGGHSLGGLYAREDAVQKNLGGLILFGAYLSGDQKNIMSLSHYPLPVLTLGGTRDGLTPITRIAKEWSQLSPDLFLKKPVIEIPELNHSLFASGSLQSGDFESPFSPEQGHEAIAEIVAAFLDFQFDAGDIGARDILMEGVRRTGPLVKGFLRAFEKDTTLCEEAQRQIPHLEGDDLKKLKVTSTQIDSFYSFSLSKPSITKGDDNELVVATSFYVSKPLNPLDISKLGQANREVACKMKSQEALMAGLKGTVSSLAHGLERRCADFNQQTLLWAADQVTDSQKRRYEKEGLRLEMGDDQKVITGIGWLPAPPNLDIENEKAILHSPTLRTTLKAPATFAGMTYCKLMPASWAVEWILVNSFKKK